MSELTYSATQDFALILFYKLAKEEILECPEGPAIRNVQYILPETEDFFCRKSIETLSDKKLIEHIISGFYIITARGLEKFDQISPQLKLHDYGIDISFREVSRGDPYFSLSLNRSYNDPGQTHQISVIELRNKKESEFLEIGSIIGPDKIPNVRRIKVPASDRAVPLNHNSTEYKKALTAVDAVINAVVGDNEYGNQFPEEKETVVNALRTGRKLLDAENVRPIALGHTLFPVLQYISDNFAKGAIAALGAAAIAALWGIL